MTVLIVAFITDHTSLWEFSALWGSMHFDWSANSSGQPIICNLAKYSQSSIQNRTSILYITLFL